MAGREGNLSCQSRLEDLRVGFRSWVWGLGGGV